MTKQEWDCKDLAKLLNQVNSDRKKQLFALACCRSIEHLMLDQRSKDCLEKIELFIDGKISKEEFKLAKQAAWDVAAWDVAAWDVATYASARAAAYAANVDNTNWAAYWAANNAANDKQAEGLKQIEFLKDIYNPYLLDLRFSELAISLAEQVYNGDDKARFVLSDYLEEEGYPDEIVMHLKSGVHYKGCWLIDQILGKQ